MPGSILTGVWLLFVIGLSVKLKSPMAESELVSIIAGFVSRALLKLT